MPVWLLPLSLLPWVAVGVLVGLRAPAVLIAIYAALLPYGSSIALPVGLPSPFNTATTVLGLVVSLGLLVHLLLGPGRARAVAAPLPWWLMFSAITLLTLQWSVSPGRTLDYLVVLASLVGLYALASFVDLDTHDLRIVEAGLAISGAVTGIYALLLLATDQMHIAGDGIPRFQTAGGGGEGGDPNITAASLVLPLVVSLAAGFSDRPLLARAAYLVSAALAGCAVLLTGSRGGLLGVVLGVLVLMRCDPRRGARIAYTVIPLLALVVTFAVASSAVQSRIQNQSSSGRNDIWQIGASACRDHCALGSGWGTFSDVYTDAFLAEAGTDSTRTRIGPHSIWLRTAIEAGWLGFAILIGALVSTWRSLRDVPNRWRGPPVAAFAGLLLTNSLLGNLDFKYFWMTLMYVAFVVTAVGNLNAVPETPEVQRRQPVAAV